MNNHRPKYSAFTLVELLTVIAIIAILMGLLFPVIGSVKDKARVVEATNVIKDLQGAISNYYADYGKYPLPLSTDPASTTDLFIGGTTTDANAPKLIRILRGSPTTNADVIAANARLISYIDLPSSKISDPAKAYSGLDKNDLLHDPWGGNYRIKMDTNYDNSLDNPYTPDSGAGPQPLTKGILIWCLGKDGKGATDGTAGQGSKTSGFFTDDIVSWQ